MRIAMMALGTVALASAVILSWWFLSGRPDVSSAIHPSGPDTQTRTTRLDHRLETNGNRLIGLVNQEPFTWTDVHLEIGDGHESFQCPTLPTIGSGHLIRVQGYLCRSAVGLVPVRICVVRVAAREGRIISALEPCLPVE